ncbi:hypothetical protein [Erwinia rhapontici]|uniref:hypothetical protein n=1 Tax=Erwinia rhapontici TaxID=55212 RepID=UPI0013316D37|nr:hypothetical protein [Erwinia rhapontici]MBP2156895.1 hypothetical protein [Erwinia rhapontici]
MNHFDVYAALKGSVAMALAIPAFFSVMCFILWENGFKVLGWKYIVRLTIVMASFPWVWELIDAFKQVKS